MGSHSPADDSGGGPVAGHLWLIALQRQQIVSHPLPPGGSVVLGRAPGCDIQLEHSTISRRHALLRLDGGLAIEDLGSANGTKVRGHKLRPGVLVQIRQGELIELGSVGVLVQERSRVPHLWTHSYFEDRVDDQFTRFKRGGTCFAILIARYTQSLDAAQVQLALAEVLRAGDVAGEHGADEYELMLMDVTPEEASKLGGAITAALTRLDPAVRVGMACYPSDATSASKLIAMASARARRDRHGTLGNGRVIVRSAAMVHVHQLVQRIAGGDISVLLLGETGVGKKVLAEMVHEQSPRRARPFVRLSCAALSEVMLDFELCGREPIDAGGATDARPGLLESAAGGTIFLDEVGELPVNTQVSLLRVLEERKTLRAGEPGAAGGKVRFVAATNRDLKAAIRQGTFRRDLYYRLAGITIMVPPLRERTEEIEPLVHHFLTLVSQRMSHRIPPRITRRALAVLCGYSWPGNIRELRNTIERAALLAEDEAIDIDHLPVEMVDKVQITAPAAETAPIADIAPQHMSPQLPAVSPAPPPAPVLPEAGWWQPDAEQRERGRIIAALEACEGNQTRAAKMLGISRRTLLNRLDRHQIPRPRKGRQRTARAE